MKFWFRGENSAMPSLIKILSGYYPISRLSLDRISIRLIGQDTVVYPPQAWAGRPTRARATYLRMYGKCQIDGTVIGQGSTLRSPSGLDQLIGRNLAHITAEKTGLGEYPKKRGSPENQNLDSLNTIQSVGRSQNHDSMTYTILRVS